MESVNLDGYHVFLMICIFAVWLFGIVLWMHEQRKEREALKPYSDAEYVIEIARSSDGLRARIKYKGKTLFVSTGRGRETLEEVQDWVAPLNVNNARLKVYAPIMERVKL